MLFMALQGCLEEEISKEGTFRFGIHPVDNTSGRVTASNPATILVTLSDAEGITVFDRQSFSLVEVGRAYLSPLIELNTGTYSIEEFLVLDETGATIYLTPQAGSEFANKVQTSLPYEFVISDDQTSEIVMDVLSIDFGTPIQFGYATFGINLIDPIESSLTAYYPFNGSASDLIGFNDGIENGGVLYSNDEFGIPNGAIAFDGADDFVVISKTSAVDFGVEDFTVTLKVRTTTNNEGTIFNTRSTSSCSQASGATIGVQVNLDGKMQVNARDETNDESFIISNVIINDGEWHLLSLRRNGSELSISVGNEVYKTTVTEGISYSTALDFYVGRTIYCNGNYYEGQVDELKIFDRFLTISEIMESYE